MEFEETLKEFPNESAFLRSLSKLKRKWAVRWLREKSGPLYNYEFCMKCESSHSSVHECGGVFVTGAID